MELEHILNGMKTTADYAIRELTATRPQELIIISLLVIAISIGAAVLINQRKIKKQLRELLDQKEDKPNSEEDFSN